jgi:hypothetical protein
LELDGAARAPEDGFEDSLDEGFGALRAGTAQYRCAGWERVIGAVRGRYIGTAPEAITGGCVLVRASITGTGRTATRVCFSMVRGAGPAYGPGRPTGSGRTRGKVTCGMGTAWVRTGSRKLPDWTKTQ